jgi:hypothetical protein
MFFSLQINGILEELVLEGHVRVYLNDILIFTETLVGHQKFTRMVVYI